jgi:hypothetical protein
MSVVDPYAEQFAIDRVIALVGHSQALGVARRQFSLASKVLHWLLPWCVPVFDSFVRQYLDVPDSGDYPRAYGQVVRDVFAMARTTVHDMSWAGNVEPLSPLHAIDKCQWWMGGCDKGHAAQVRDPWRVIDRLGLDRS